MASRRGPSPEEALSAYRHALIRGASAEELARLAETIDADVIATLEWARETGRAARLTPDSVFANRLERELRRGFAATATDPLPFRTAPPIAPATEVPQSPPPRQLVPLEAPISQPRWAWQALAATAVLVLMVAGAMLGYRLFMAERPQTVFLSSGEPVFETLVNSAVESVRDQSTPIAIERWRFQPDATLTIPAQDGPQWIVAENGTFVVTVDGAAQPLAAGHGVVVPAGQTVELRSTGLEEASALRGVAAASFSLEEFDPAVVTSEVALDTDAHESLPPGTSRIIFSRLTLPPDAAITLEPATGQDWLSVVSGTLAVTLSGDTLPRGWTTGNERDMAAGDPFPVLVPGTTVSLRNPGEEPVVVLRLQVTPLSSPSES